MTNYARAISQFHPTKILNMSRSVITVANTLLEKAIAEDEVLTHMKLQKMTYCLHGWHLARLETPACAEPVGAWKYGPVFMALYREFKRFGGDNIDDFAYVVDEDGDRVYRVVSEENRIFHKVLEETWQKYAGYSATQLSTLTHQKGTPWHQAREAREPFIDNDAIRKHFIQIIESGGVKSFDSPKAAAA